MGRRDRFDAVDFYERPRVVHHHRVSEILADGLQKHQRGTENGDGIVRGILTCAIYNEVSDFSMIRVTAIS